VACCSQVEVKLSTFLWQCWRSWNTVWSKLLRNDPDVLHVRLTDNSFVRSVNSPFQLYAYTYTSCHKTTVANLAFFVVGQTNQRDA